MIKLKKKFNIFIYIKKYKHYKLEQFELIFEKLKLETNVKDIDEFVELFSGQEQANKELYEQADELSDEVKFNKYNKFQKKLNKLYFKVEKLENQIKLLNKDIEKFSENKPSDDLTSTVNQKEMDLMKVI